MDHSGLSAGPKLLCLPKLNTSRQFRFLWNNAQNTIYDIFWNLVNIRIQSKRNKQGIFMTKNQWISVSPNFPKKSKFSLCKSNDLCRGIFSSVLLNTIFFAWIKPQYEIFSPVLTLVTCQANSKLNRLLFELKVRKIIAGNIRPFMLISVPWWKSQKSSRPSWINNLWWPNHG